MNPSTESKLMVLWIWHTEKRKKNNIYS